MDLVTITLSTGNVHTYPLSGHVQLTFNDTHKQLTVTAPTGTNSTLDLTDAASIVFGTSAKDVKKVVKKPGLLKRAMKKVVG